MLKTYAKNGAASDFRFRVFRGLRKRPEQCAHFLVHVRRIGQGLGDFIPEQLAVTLAQPVHGHAHSTFINAQRLCGYGMG